MQKRTELGRAATLLKKALQEISEMHKDARRFGFDGKIDYESVTTATREAIEKETGEPAAYIYFELRMRVDAYWLFRTGIGAMMGDLLTYRENRLVDTLVLTARSLGGAR